MTPRRSARASGDSGDLDLFPRPEPAEHPPPPRTASGQPAAERSARRHPAATRARRAQSAITYRTLTETARERHRRRVHSALGARRGQRLQGAPQRTLVLHAPRPHGADPLRRLEPRSAADSRAARRRHAGRRVRPARPCIRRAARCSSPSRASTPRATGCGARRSRRRARDSRRTGCSRPERKRALPRFPRVIAVITSPDGAALHDIVAVVRGVARRRAARRRAGGGAGRSARRASCAPRSTRVERWGRADLVIIGRGGGAREDLWAFNDETRRARRRRVSGADDLRGRPRDRHVDLRSRRRHARADAVRRRRSRDAIARRARGRVAERLGSRLDRRRRARQFARARIALRHVGARPRRARASSVVAGDAARIQVDRRAASRSESTGDARARLRGRARRPEGATLSVAPNRSSTGMPFDLDRARRSGSGARPWRAGHEATMTFEQRLARLEAIAAQLEREDVDLAQRARALRGGRRASARRVRRARQRRGHACTDSWSAPTAPSTSSIGVSERSPVSVDWTGRSRRDRSRARPRCAIGTRAIWDHASPTRSATACSAAANAFAVCCFSRRIAPAGGIARRERARGGDRGGARVFARPRRPAVHGRRRHAPRPADGASRVRRARRRRPPASRWSRSPRVRRSRAARALGLPTTRARRAWSRELMRASGAGGMIGGQLLDLEGEGATRSSWPSSSESIARRPAR